MFHTNVYLDLDSKPIPLGELDADERKLVETLSRRAKSHPDWNDFDNFWLKAVATFYERRGLTRSQVVKTAPWQIAQDLSSRIGIAAGLMRAGDYRDELEELIRTRFKTRREFCEATGLSEDMLSHVLHKRKHLAIDTLADALGQIGYTLHIAPLPQVE